MHSVYNANWILVIMTSSVEILAMISFWQNTDRLLSDGIHSKLFTGIWCFHKYRDKLKSLMNWFCLIRVLIENIELINIFMSVLVISVLGKQMKILSKKHLNNRKLLQPRGRCVGGSSTANLMLYVRGNKESLFNWYLIMWTLKIQLQKEYFHEKFLDNSSYLVI